MTDATRVAIVAALKAGRTLVIERRDSPAWPIAMELEREGLAVSELVQYDEQSSAIKYWWAGSEAAGR